MTYNDQLAATCYRLAAGAAASPHPTKPLSSFGSHCATFIHLHAPPLQDRKFHSPAVEAYLIEREQQNRRSRTGVALSKTAIPTHSIPPSNSAAFEGKPDTAVITGDIPAMWLRDSSAQVWPYLALAAKDAALRHMLEGIIRRQARCILIDPYANAFMADLDAPPLEWSRSDATEMKRGVGERKVGTRLALLPNASRLWLLARNWRYVLPSIKTGAPR